MQKLFRCSQSYKKLRGCTYFFLINTPKLCAAKIIHYLKAQTMRFIQSFILLILTTGISTAQTAPTKTFSEKLSGIETTSKQLTSNASTDNSSVGQSGVMGTSIPLVNVKSRTMEFPIELHYSSGIKAEQQSSSVGLGWTLPFGSIARDYGAFEPDYSSTSHEADMINYDDPNTYKGNLNASTSPMNPDLYNESLIYDVIEYAEVRDMPLSDFYRINVPGLKSNSFWNRGEINAPHVWAWTELEKWKVEHQTKTFTIDQELSRINEINVDGTFVSKENFNLLESIASAIGVLPYVINGEARLVSDVMLLSEAEKTVKYEDFEQFTITIENGVQYVFGRPLRGQKFVLSDNPY